MNKDVFRFNKRARKSIVVFTILMAIVLMAPRVAMLFQPNDKIVIIQSNTEKQNQKEFEKKEFKSYKSDYTQKGKENKTGTKYKKLVKKTDPNLLTENDWKNLGLSEKQVSSILKFKERIKGFKKSKDVENLFVLPRPLWELIKDSLEFPKSGNVNVTQNTASTTISSEIKPKLEAKTKKIEVNSASEEELLDIPGIGPFFAKGIIKLRTQLGGYANHDQLLEVWKMTPESYEKIKPFLTIDVSLIQKLNINTADAQELKQLNYITWNVANSIVKIRQQHGRYESVNDLKKSVLINEELLAKLKPYLTI